MGEVGWHAMSGGGGEGDMLMCAVCSPSGGGREGGNLASGARGGHADPPAPWSAHGGEVAWGR